MLDLAEYSERSGDVSVTIISAVYWLIHVAFKKKKKPPFISERTTQHPPCCPSCSSQ